MNPLIIFLIVSIILIIVGVGMYFLITDVIFPTTTTFQPITTTTTLAPTTTTTFKPTTTTTTTTTTMTPAPIKGISLGGKCLSSTQANQGYINLNDCNNTDYTFSSQPGGTLCSNQDPTYCLTNNFNKLYSWKYSDVSSTKNDTHAQWKIVGGKIQNPYQNNKCLMADGSFNDCSTAPTFTFK